MLEKLKGVIQGAKGLLVWVITPLLAILGLVFYLIKSKDSLQEENSELKAEGQTATDKEKANEADSNAAVDLDSYKRMRAIYLAAQTKKPKL